MPSVSKAQNRYVQAAAARGEKWAIRWAREQHGKPVHNLPERVGEKHNATYYNALKRKRSRRGR